MISDTRDSESPFGILDFLAWNHPWNQNHYTPEKIERAASLMQEAGVGFVRVDFLWDDIERVPGRFDFSKYDDLVDRLMKHNIKILALLLYSPTWEGQPWNRAPDPRLYSRYARQVVRRYKDRIRHWEIWNEPDHAMYWEPQDGMLAYSELLKTVYPVLKDEDLSCIVHLAGTSKGLPACLKQVYQQGAQEMFDIVNIHPYTNPLMLNAIDGMRILYDNVRAIMREAGDENKPIWFTEVGCPGIDHSKDIAPWWFGKNPSEAEQAAWVKRIYEDVIPWGVEKIFWAFFRDVQEHWKSGVDYFGLIRNDFSKKPAFNAFQQLTAASKANVVL